MDEPGLSCGRRPAPACAGGSSEVGQAFGQGHLDALVFQVEFAQIGFCEGDEDIAFCTFDNEQGDGAGAAVDVLDTAYGDGIAGDVDEFAADEVGDVDFVFRQGGAFGARDGDDEAGEFFCLRDGVDASEVQDDGAFVQPVMGELDGAGSRVVPRDGYCCPTHTAALRRHGWGTRDFRRTRWL